MKSVAILRFGSQSNGEPWEEPVSARSTFFLVFILDSAQVKSWVCATIPMAGTVTYDCIPEVAALSPLLAFGCLVPPPQHSLSVNFLAVTLSVAQSFPI